MLMWMVMVLLLRRMRMEKRLCSHLPMWRRLGRPCMMIYVAVQEGMQWLRMIGTRIGRLLRQILSVASTTATTTTTDTSDGMRGEVGR